MKATFAGGPLDGQERDLRDGELLEGRPAMWYELGDNARLNPRSGPPAMGPYYALHFVDKRGVPHYYVPTSER
jgi:hypothetical protein